MSDQDGEPKPSRRKRAPADDSEAKAQSEPKRRPAVESGVPDSEVPPRSRRRAATAKADTAAEQSTEQPAPRPKRKPPEPAGKAESQPTAEEAVKSKKAASKKATPAKAPPKGRIARTIWLARMIIRYAPVWGIIVILLGIFIRIRFPPVTPSVAPLFRPEVQYWTPQITRWAQEYGVNPNLIATLMQIESCGLPGAASQVGAQGLFQVMPSNFRDDELPNMTEPETNARAGIQVIKDCLRYAEGDVGLAMACYNGGPRLIYVDPFDWPTETQHYYTWGGGIYNDAIRNASTSDTLNQWLAAGGIGLCERAAEALGLSTNTTMSTPISNPTPSNTPAPVLPTLAVIQPGQIQVTTMPGSLPTFAMPTSAPSN